MKINTWNEMKEFYLSFSNIENEDPNDKDEVEDDATIAKRDPIYGAVICMGLISRLRYFLCQPSNIIPSNIKLLTLDIIERFLYHSPFLTSYIFEVSDDYFIFYSLFLESDLLKIQKDTIFIGTL
jgi:hypothetical protein